MKNLNLVFYAQVRAQEWYAELYQMDWWKPFDTLTIELESRNAIVMIIDAFQDDAYTKIILSLN